MAETAKSQREQKFRSLFDLPSNIFDSCRLLLFDNPLIPSTVEPSPSHQPESNVEAASSECVSVEEEPYFKVPEEKVKGGTQRWTCNLCKSEFESLQDQRSHFKSDLHRLNVKLSVSGKNIVKEEEFDEQGFDYSFENFDVSSISGSEDELEKGAFTAVKTREGVKQKLYFRLHSGEIVSLWRNLILDESEDVSIDDYKIKQAKKDGNSFIIGEEELINRLKNLLLEPRDKSRLRIILLLTGGHFAGCVFDGNTIIAHKTFHRYVVRAKAGKKQSTKDATGKSAHSAGSSLRRHNEAALKKEIQDLLFSWKPHINSSLCIFVHAPSRNRQILFDGEKQNLHIHDRVVRQIPLTVRRPTLKEAKRIYLCLTQLSYEEDEKGSSREDEGKINQVFQDSQAINTLEVEASSSPFDSSLESVTENLSSDLADVGLYDYKNRSTPLHAAAQSGNAQWTLELLEQGCNPCLKDERGRTPYILATEKEVRNTFRRFMAVNLDRWDWQAANVPSPLTKEMEESQAAKQMQKDAKRKAKAKELKMLRKAKEKAKMQEHETPSENSSTFVPQNQMSARVAPSKQQQLPNSRKQLSEEGTTPMAVSGQQPKSNGALISKEEEKKQALVAEREKRAAAAERRIAAMKNQGSTAVIKPIGIPDTGGVVTDLLCSFCHASLAGKIPFHRYHYKYCSSSCMHAHREFLDD